MITEVAEVWLKRDRTLARYVGAYLVCDLFQVPCFNWKLNAFWCRLSFNFSSTVNTCTLNRTVAIVLIMCIYVLGLYTTLFAIGIYVLYINCSGPIRWPFLIAIVVMYSLATADALFALYMLMQFRLCGKEFPVLVPLPTVLLFVTSRCVRMSSSLERP